ncbi:class II glutamine amidotransferase [Undibacterium sp. Ren11W]|uniref:class II glutamine amidotransferase n=1 Tax=Undibacterium sp. Ren11W TaxID=3413045 RepID=UPI003BF0EA3E
MCRFTLYLGPAIRLSSLLIKPAHSLIHQSTHAAERSEPLNGDGFGIGWYAPRLSKEPAVFHSVTPAWNNRNLHSISNVLASPCVFAHVRAATEGSDVHMANCHPFKYGRYLLMHNGSIGAFARVRRQLTASLSDQAYGVIRGSTDTELLFAVFIDELLKHGEPDSMEFSEEDGAGRLAGHLSATLARVLAAVGELGDAAPSFLNVAVSNGDCAAVSRFSSASTAPADSLYILHGELYPTTAEEFSGRAVEDAGAAVIVSSERLTQHTEWRAVPAAHIVAFSHDQVPQLFALDKDGRIVAASVE